MKIILAKDIKGLGRAGEIKEVADGYARNSLIPSGQAKLATADSIRQVQVKRQVIDSRRQKKQDQYRGLSQKFIKRSLHFTAKVSPAGTQFAANGPDQIKQAILEQGIEVPVTAMKIKQPIKEPGEHWIVISLASQPEVRLKCLVQGA